MTLMEKMTGLLVENGLFHHQIDAIMELVIQEPALNDRGSPWNAAVENCPKEYVAAVWYVVKKCAIKWLETNMPSHFALQMLAD